MEVDFDGLFGLNKIIIANKHRDDVLWGGAKFPLMYISLFVWDHLFGPSSGIHFMELRQFLGVSLIPEDDKVARERGKILNRPVKISTEATKIKIKNLIRDFNNGENEFIYYGKKNIYCLHVLASTLD
jgi:hypothetical protein